MGGSTDSNPCSGPSGGYNAILRVSHPWPVRTKKALRMSLHEGIFEDFSVIVPFSSLSTNHTVYFAGAVDKEVGSPISRHMISNHHADELITENPPVCRSEPPGYWHETSLSTFVADIHVRFLAPHIL